MNLTIRNNGVDILKYLKRIFLSIFFLDNFMLNRIGYYFLLLSILPLYVYMKHLYMCYKGRMWCYCMAAVFLLFYFLKTVLFAEGEYDYQSIYF